MLFRSSGNNSLSSGDLQETHVGALTGETVMDLLLSLGAIWALPWRGAVPVCVGRDVGQGAGALNFIMFHLEDSSGIKMDSHQVCGQGERKTRQGL